MKFTIEYLVCTAPRFRDDPPWNEINSDEVLSADYVEADTRDEALSVMQEMLFTAIRNYGFTVEVNKSKTVALVTDEQLEVIGFVYGFRAVPYEHHEKPHTI